MSFPPRFQQGDPFSFPGVGLGNTPLSGVNLGFYHAVLGSKRSKVNLRSPRSQPGSNFHFWAQNFMGVLSTKFYPYPIITSHFGSFLRSIIIFSAKGLLTPEAVAGGFSLTRVLFSGFVSFVDCHAKKNQHATVHHFA